MNHRIVARETVMQAVLQHILSELSNINLCEMLIPSNCSGLNLSVKKGELIAVVGPVACGKTTLLMSLIQVTGTKLYHTKSNIETLKRYILFFEGRSKNK